MREACISKRESQSEGSGLMEEDSDTVRDATSVNRSEKDLTWKHFLYAGIGVLVRLAFTWLFVYLVGFLLSSGTALDFSK